MKVARIRRVITTALVGTWAGCGTAEREAPPSPGHAAIRDSAGVAIIENHAAAGDASWTLAAEPSLVIGDDETDPDAVFQYVTSATRLSDGHVAIGTLAGEVVLFSESGDRLRSIGRRGRGPGEFDSPAGTVVLPGEGDDVFVAGLSPRQWKVVRFTPAGEIVDEIAASGAALFGGASWDLITTPSGVVFRISAPLDDGRPVQSEVMRLPAFVVRHDLVSGTADTVAIVPGPELLIADVGPRRAFGGGLVSGPRSISPLFGATTRMAGGGTPFRIAIGDQTRPAFDLHDIDGGIERRVRWEASGRRPGSRDLELAGRSLLESPEGRRDTAAARRTLAVLPRPSRTPVFHEIRVDRAGHIWVERYPLPTDSTGLWWVFDPAGHLVASVEMPSGLVILEIGEDYVIGCATDEYDVQRVEVRPLIRASPRGGPSGGMPAPSQPN